MISRSPRVVSMLSGFAGSGPAATWPPGPPAGLDTFSTSRDRLGAGVCRGVAGRTGRAAHQRRPTRRPRRGQHRAGRQRDRGREPLLAGARCRGHRPGVVVGGTLRMLAPGPHVRIGSTVTRLAAVGAAAASLLAGRSCTPRSLRRHRRHQDIAAAFFHAVNVTDMIKLVVLGVRRRRSDDPARASRGRPPVQPPGAGPRRLLTAGRSGLRERGTGTGWHARCVAASLVLLLGWAIVAAVFTVRLGQPADGRAVVESRREAR